MLIGPFPPGSLFLPMLATRVCAGFPSPADDFIDDELDLNRLMAPNRPATFLWRVQGSSMVDVGIQDGAVVVVDRSLRPKPGQVVVASINGETSLKVLQPDGKLAFANRSMPAWSIDEAADVEIWGVVTWTLHKPQA